MTKDTKRSDLSYWLDQQDQRAQHLQEAQINRDRLELLRLEHAAERARLLVGLAVAEVAEGEARLAQMRADQALAMARARVEVGLPAVDEGAGF